MFINREHDHIGILLKLEKEKLVVAEGNVGDTNCSGVVRREKDEHIRAIIRIPDGYIYEKELAERRGENGQKRLTACKNCGYLHNWKDKF